MPSPSTLTEFISLVTEGHFVEAMERFYCEDVSAQENDQPSRVGLATLIAHERATLASFKQVRAAIAEPPIHVGDRVVIHWLFEFDHPAGFTLKLDELALQTWSGEQLASERFFYDPAQMARPA